MNQKGCHQFPPTFKIIITHRVFPDRTGDGGKATGGACPYISFPIGGIGTEVLSGATG